ncbi:hypothetical protein [Lewinella sp. W8]|uniref:hypothetical protein n=1 Tax=Lewinella sp. W8 TaxID=2528208 RepID=UPI00106859EF|nr:hypothetical protein [Lewinella sp. W8]MTB51144.1 hypothetical protein [Lewinella sp. W8]
MSLHLIRQIDHWQAATQRLSDFQGLASASTWEQLERYTDTFLRARLGASVRRLQQEADHLMQLARQEGAREEDILRDLQQLRRRYLATEVTLDYFGDAINTRTNPSLGRHLAALDKLAGAAIERALRPLGHLVPPVMTYIDKGLGASILKAGLRLWDQRGVNPVAVIKVVRHNIYRPTALIHEAGHQIAYALNWNAELAEVLRRELSSESPVIGNLWAGWSSEIAADAFAFAYTGYGAVATLHDVLSGGPNLVFQYRPGAVHPMPYLRTLLGIEMCRLAFGSGPWDDLERNWIASNPLHQLEGEIIPWLKLNRLMVPKVAAIVLQRPMRAFGGSSLQQYLPIQEVHPRNLLQWGSRLGPPNAWPVSDLRNNSLRLLALSVYKQVTESYQSPAFRREMDHWFSRLTDWPSLHHSQPQTAPALLGEY